MNEREVIARLPKMTDARQIADILMDGVNGKHDAVIQAAYRRLKEVDRIGAEAFEQVMRDKGVKLPPLTMTDMKESSPSIPVSPKVGQIRELLNKIKADSSNHGLRAIMSSGSEAQTIRSLTDEEVKQAAPVLRELQAEMRTIRTYTEGRMRAFQAGERGPDAGFLMLMITMFKQLEGAVDDAVAKAPKSGCFIATACYGAYDHPAVQQFRWLRDNRLDRHICGKRFVEMYYRLSPPIAEFLQKRPVLAATVRRCLLAPILHLVTAVRKGPR